MKVAVDFSKVNKDKCYKDGNALGCSADVGEDGFDFEEERSKGVEGQPTKVKS